MTLELAETQESSAVIGYKGSLFKISLGVFKGNVKKTGDSDDHLDDYLAKAVFIFPENKTFSLTVGVLYL